MDTDAMIVTIADAFMVGNYSLAGIL